MDVPLFDESELPTCKEVSREELLSKFLTDDALNDFSLEGIDGVKVRANRRILAARSEVFHKMLVGEFSEASSPNVRVGYNGIVLRAIVEYMHTDTAQILDFVKEESRIIGLDDTMRVQALVSLAGAAAYFNLPGLCRKTYDCLADRLVKSPSLSLAVLDVCSKEGPSVPKQFEVLALSRIDPTIFTNMNASALAHVSASTLQAILESDNIYAEEYQLFQILQLWRDAVETHPLAEADRGTDLPFSTQDRHSIASELVKQIHLEWINPKILSTSVKSSGLVTHEQLMEAYEVQALTAQEQHGVDFERRRFTPPIVWGSSKSKVSRPSESRHQVDLLECPPMTSGVHEWTIKIEANSPSTTAWLGVASKRHSIDMTSWLGRQNGGWVCSNTGTTYHANSMVSCGHPRFLPGDEVTFTLNLTEENSGTLTSSVNGAAAVEIFSGLRAHWNRQEEGFVPAVSLCFPACIRLLHFRRFESLMARDSP